jgi:hypothetical protein
VSDSVIAASQTSQFGLAKEFVPAVAESSNVVVVVWFAGLDSTTSAGRMCSVELGVRQIRMETLCHHICLAQIE